MKKQLFTRLFMLMAIMVAMATNAWGYKLISDADFQFTQQKPGVLHFKIRIASYRNGTNYCWLNNNMYHKLSCYHQGEYVCNIAQFQPIVPSSLGDWVNGKGFQVNLGGATNRSYISDISGTVSNELSTDKGYYRYALTTDGSPEPSCFLEFDWHIPTKLAGCDSVEVRYFSEVYFYNSPSNSTSNRQSSSLSGTSGYFDAPAWSRPTLQTSTIAVPSNDDNDKAGKIMVLWTTDQKVYHAWTFATTNSSVWPTSHSYYEQLNGVMNSQGYIAPKDTAQYVRFAYSMEYNNDPKLGTDTRYSDTMKVEAYHQIHNFDARFYLRESDGLRHGDVLLMWDVYNATAEDIMSNDAYEIERATKADFSDAENIGYLMFEKDSTHYQYIDSSDVVRAQKTPFYYRVRRASAGIWGWDNNLYTQKMAAKDSITYQPWNKERLLKGLQEDYDRYIKMYLIPEVNKQVSATSTGKWIIEKDAEGKYTQIKYYYKSKSHTGAGQASLQQSFSTIYNPYQPDSINWEDHIYQPLLADTSLNSVEKDSKWADNRKVIISTAIPMKYCTKRYTRNNMKYEITVDTCLTDDYDFVSTIKLLDGNIFDKDNSLWKPSSSYDGKVTDDGLNSYYWDIQTTPIYIEKTTSHEGLVSVQSIRLPAESITWSKTQNRFNIKYEDVADIACTKYAYALRIDTTRIVLPIDSTSKFSKSRIELLDADSFYFDGGMRVDTVIASYKESPDWVRVEWEAKGGSFDEYTVMRRALEHRDTIVDCRKDTVEVTLYKDSIAIEKLDTILTPNRVKVTSADLQQYKIDPISKFENGYFQKYDYRIVRIDTTWYTARIPIGVDTVAIDVCDTIARYFPLDDWEIIATTPDLVYVDRRAPIGRDCDYCVEGMLVCHDTIRYLSQPTKGQRDCYGSVSGYVTYPNGIACRGVEVRVYNDNNVLMRPPVLTDERGAYTVDSVFFSEEPITYSVMAMHPTMTAIQYLNPAGTTDPIRVDLNGYTADLKNINFTNASGTRFTGRVLYEGSTVPVYHAQFKVNDELQLHADGTPVESDASGNFELLVPGGSNVYDSIQVVMEGHTFMNNGFIQVEDGKNRIWMNKPVDGARMYDLTKAKMIGRVVGGLDEGQKRLGYDESVNNIGDSITLVLELEGDNISHLVHNPRDLTEKERDTTFTHFMSQGIPKEMHSTNMHMTQKRITIHPDPLTGEYQVDLYPARYRIVQATAQGYSTLFPEGTTSQTIDLTKGITQPIDTLGAFIKVDANGTAEWRNMEVNEKYSLIYRAPIEMTLTQLKKGTTPQSYYGEAEMLHYRLDGKTDTVNILIQHTDTTFKQKGANQVDTVLTQVTDDYLLGYPVFQSDETYTYRVYAREVYRYNNDKAATRFTEVPLTNHELTIYNGLSKAGTVSRAMLDAHGMATFQAVADNPTFTLSGEEALRTLEVRTIVNGLYEYTKPLSGYIVASKVATDGVDASSSVIALSDKAIPYLIDIVRDPYGSGSSAWIEKGTKYTYSADFTFALTVGASLGFTWGVNYKQVTGITGGIGPFAGVVFGGESTYGFSLPITTGFHVKKHNEYSLTTSDRISTSSATSMIGSPADVYYGSTWKAYAARMRSITLIDDSTYLLKRPAITDGSIRVIAEQTKRVAGSTKTYYLVVSDVIAPYIEMSSATFAYTQSHIMNILLPDLLKQRNALLLEGDSASMQQLADATNTAVYQTLVTDENKNYGLEKGYKQYTPGNKGGCTDEVKKYNELIAQWVGFIKQNEKIKLDVIKNEKNPEVYSISSGVTVSKSISGSHAGYSDIVWDGINVGVNINGVGYGPAIEGEDKDNGTYKGLNDKNAQQFKKIVDAATSQEHNDLVTDFSLPASKFKFTITPIVSPSMNRNASALETKSKSTGYTLSTGGSGYEDIAVYQLTSNTLKDSKDKVTGDDFNSQAKDDRHDADGLGGNSADEHLYADFVFIRKGGATRCPYEGADVAIFSNDTISRGTLKIDNPKLTINTRELSNVPADEAATFVLTIANESDLPGFRPDLVGTTFWLSQVNSSNTNGLTITMDGSVITDGRAFVLRPGESVQKTIKVYRGVGYDYEDIQLALVSDCQSGNKSICNFSVHYQPVSCPVSMTLPVDKWILNTLAPKDDQGYYLPVEITGFNVNYDEFDHIELQYKLQTHGDDRWVNLCSYYADSALFALASGNKQMIENGQIRNVRFYGERDPMEQQYDLRAVSFCRLGNGFVTRASEVRSGLKDTRVPRLFGAPTPANGILGVGDYISIPYSENIAANYLDEDNNFDITGYTNSSKASTDISLAFSGDSTSYGYTEVSRDLSGSNFSFDVMVYPETTRNMTYFAQGNADNYISLGQFARIGNAGIAIQMCQTVDGVRSQNTVKTVGSVINKGEWTHVVVTYASETGEVHIYVNGDDKTDPNNNKLPAGYKGIGKLALGRNPAMSTANFQGKMVEARLWKKALTLAQARSVMGLRLTGFEHGLYDYFPLNEGRGNLAYNKANASGAVLHMEGLNWIHPEGLGLRIGKIVERDTVADVYTWAADTLALEGSNAFPAIENGDYTLTFWYRTDNQEPCTLFQASNFHIEADSTGISLIKLANHKSVHQETAIGNYLTGDWHQLALSCSKATGYGSLFIDGVSVLQFNAANFDAPNDSRMFFGPMLGAVDDLTYWNIALPTNYLQEYYAHSPNDKEMGLVTHVSFSERRINDFGVYNTYYCPYNQKKQYDAAGQLVPRKETDRVVLRQDTLITKDKRMLVDNAPIADKGDLVKMNFSWVGKDNELVIDLKMLDKEINKQNIFVTVRDVEDLAGNPQTSPITMTIFVDRNQLRWSAKYLQTTLYQGESERLQIDLLNNGGTTMNYYIEDTPWWIEPSVTRGQLSPLEQKPISLLISDKLDPGEYETLIYLTDENGLSEPLRVMVHVKAVAPNWEVDPITSNGKNSGLFAQVQMVSANEAIYYDTDTADIVAAFLQNICIGVSHITYEDNFSLLCLGFRGSDDDTFQKMVNDSVPIRFLLWQASTGRVYALNTVDSTRIYYKDNALIGSPDHPVQLRTNALRNQMIPLRAGWNWISFNIKPDKSGQNFTDALTGNYQFHETDMVKSGTKFVNYEDNEWHGIFFHFYHSNIYMVRAREAGQLGVQGEYLEDADRAVYLKGSGWNNLPYLCEKTQDVTTALADYRESATPGDVVKSYTTFAMLNEAGRWVGSLTHLQPGEGYMLYRQAPTDVIMHYQALHSNSALDAPATLIDEEENTDLTIAASALHRTKRSHNMPIVATCKIQLATCHLSPALGDRLQAYVGTELVGEAVADEDGRFMLMTSADEGTTMHFVYTPADPALGAAEGSIKSLPIAQYGAEKAALGTIEHPYEIVFDQTTDMATVYPSPFTDHLTFAVTCNLQPTTCNLQPATCHLQLTTSTGTLIWEHEAEITDGLWQYTLSHLDYLPAGVYIATIRLADRVTNVKLIKE